MGQQLPALEDVKSERKSQEMGMEWGTLPELVPARSLKELMQTPPIRMRPRLMDILSQVQ